MVLLKYLSNARRNLEIPLINSKINLIMTWSAIFVLVSTVVAKQGVAFVVTDIKPYVTLTTHDNVKLIQQLKSDFKRSISWNKYQSKVPLGTQNQYLDSRVDPNFQGVNRFFSCTTYFFLIVEVKDYNISINAKYNFDQPINND